MRSHPLLTTLRRLDTSTALPSLADDLRSHPLLTTLRPLTPVHIVLNVTGICAPFFSRSIDSKKLETFCNYVAGAALVPMAELLDHPLVNKIDESNLVSNLTDLSKHFKVSRDVILRRLLIGRKISKKIYDETKKDFAKSTKEPKSGKGNFYLNYFSSNSKEYNKIILQGLNSENLSIHKALSYLEVKYETFEKIQEQATLYQACVDNMLQQIDDAEGIQRRGLILSMLIKLKQICNHPGLFLLEFPSSTGVKTQPAVNYSHPTQEQIGRSGKLEALLNSVENIIDVNEKVLIFTQYSTMGAEIQNFLSRILNIRVGFLCGATPQNERASLVEEFQNPNSSLKVFVLSLKAGGLGLTLTRANHVIHYDRWWNPAVENQASDRVYRIGQQKSVYITKYVCKGTLEEKIQQLIEQKKALSANILTTGDHWITSLNSNDLRNLITLQVDNLLQETSCLA